MLVIIFGGSGVVVLVFLSAVAATFSVFTNVFEGDVRLRNLDHVVAEGNVGRECQRQGGS